MAGDSSAGKRKREGGFTRYLSGKQNAVSRADLALEITNIYVETFTKLTISLEVKPSDTIGDVKVKIRAKFPLPPDQQALIFDEMILDDTNTLQDLNIHNNSTIKLMHISRGLMPIIVNVPKMMMDICLEAKPSDTIGNLKSMIWDKKGIHPDEHVLIFNEMVLEESGTLVDFHIKKYSSLKLMFKSRGLMKIFVNTLATGTGTETAKAGKIILMVKPTDTISKVKDKIELQVSIPRHKQVLIFNQVVLDDSGTLAGFHINMESTLILMRKSGGFIQINISNHNLNTITLEVNTLDTIADLKAKIQEKEGLPSCAFVLLLDEMRLVEDYTLAYYHIFEESPIQLCLQQTGS